MRSEPAYGAALNLPNAAKLQTDVTALDYQLAARASMIRPGVRWWWGERSVGPEHGARCYLCGLDIAVWASYGWLPEVQRDRIIDHRDRVHGPAAA